MFVNSFWALLPAIIAIALALITKEVYSSLFIGIIVGGLLYTNFNIAATMQHVFVDGMIGQLSDSWNVGILVFLVVLGSMVMLMNRAGGSAAFGRWAVEHVKTKAGAQVATIVLGCLIFIDDYFNCLTVGSVMRPLTDKHKISREKLAYLIDATAAPVCIIAPISSWAAAVFSCPSGFTEGDGKTGEVGVCYYDMPTTTPADPLVIPANLMSFQLRFPAGVEISSSLELHCENPLATVSVLGEPNLLGGGTLNILNMVNIAPF